MKFEKRTIVAIVVAILFLIWYLIQQHAILVEGNETILKTISNQLSLDKYKNPTDPVIIGQKINIYQQHIDLLTKMLADQKFVTPKSKKAKDDKAKYETMLKDSTTALPILKQQLDTAQKALDESIKKK